MESTVTAPYGGRGGRRRRGAERPGRARARRSCGSGRRAGDGGRACHRGARPRRAGGTARRGHPAVRAGVRRAAQLPARLRPRPRDAQAAAGRAAAARRDQPAGRPGTAALRGRAARPVRRGRGALPAAHGDPARRRADREQHPGVPAGVPAVDGRRPGRAAGRLPGAARAGAGPLRRDRPGAHAGARRRGGVDVPVVQPGRRARPGRACRSSTRRLRAGGAFGAGRRTPGCAPGSTGWPPPRRAATRASRTWPATCGSATSTSRCSRRSCSGEYAETEAVLDGVEADPDGPGRDAAVARLVAVAAPAAGGAAPPLAGHARPRRPPDDPRGLRPPLLPHPRAARPALRGAPRPPAVRHRLRLGEQAHPPGRRLRRAGRAARRRGRGRRAPRRGADRPAGRRRPRVLAGRGATVHRRDGPRGGVAAGRLRLRPAAVAAGRHRDQHRRRGGRALPHPAPQLPAGRRTAGSARTCSTATCTRCWPSGSTCGGWRTSGSSGSRRPRTSTSSTAWPTRTRRTTGCSRSPRCATSRRCRDAAGVAVVPLARSGWGCRRWPRCARRWPGFPPRERPKANRIVLYVRPPWDVPRETWPSLASSFAPLAEGADLEKVLLRVRIPEGDGVRARRGPGRRGRRRHGVTVAERPLGDEPVRPLTPYRQKVLVAQRFGVPYPYEIVRMLAAGPGASADFPPGSFVEHDLDERRRRWCRSTASPGRNTANVVVGLLTSTTDEGAGGDDPGRAAQRPDPRAWATWPSRSAAGSSRRWTWRSGCGCRSSGSRSPPAR